ncbi:interleukin-13 receptor subunit alpha-1-like isoform 2-T2 [Acanthopagrus schlegelii]
MGRKDEIDPRTPDDNMTPRGFPTALLYTAMIITLHCEADLCPPPTELSHKWLDKFTLRLFWKKPKDLPDNNNIKFLLKDHNEKDTCVSGTDYTTFLLTEDVDSNWTYRVWTNCSQLASKENTPAEITIKPPRPRAKVVKDFKCFADTKKCSWIPVNPSLNLTLSYRMKGESEECIKSLQQCDQPYSLGERNGCHLNINNTDNICILVETEAGMSTFEPVFVVHPPKLNITEKGDSLIVNLRTPKVGVTIATGCWQYDVCYKKCSNSETCQNTGDGGHTMTMPYDKRCLYEFKARVKTTKHCGDISSDWSKDVSYGINKPPDRTLTVAAIVIPIILSICVILSCYCFKRHSAIICPTIPDPSTIFKEMMMNGPRELQNGGNLYKPVPERLEPCKVVLVPENSVLQQTS